MKWTPLDPPRKFRTGSAVDISDCGRLELDPDEQITLVTPSGSEYDVARKSWGYYATPSLNGRLLQFGLRAALVRNQSGRYYVFLVERGHEPQLDAYLLREQNQVVRWLDNDQDLRAAEAPSLRCLCGSGDLESAHVYSAAPEGEVRFAHTSGEYRREIWRCRSCGHYLSLHSMEDPSLYGGAYVDSTYGDEAGMRRTFERIISLPAEKSDNAGRVLRIAGFAEAHFGPGARSILDVGSGLCVFLNGMKRLGWRCTALDPDPRAASHAREVVGVEAIAADWFTAADLGSYDVITFNKVLEHVKDPIAMLARARTHLTSQGVVYVELPDGEAAARDSFGREEFFIEHWHVFSAASLAILAERAGFRTLSIERLREPSSKYTLRAFLAP